MRRYFYDTEFVDDGKTIDLVSIGIVDEDGREYYAVSNEFDVGKLHANKWLVDNVWPHLPLRHRHKSGTRCRCLYGHLDREHPAVLSRAQIARGVRDFILGPESDEPQVELWAWYAAYDHVVLAQLWGPMMNLPPGIPMYTCDLKQEADRQGDLPLPDQAEGEHNALADARHNLVRARALGLVP